MCCYIILYVKNKLYFLKQFYGMQKINSERLERTWKNFSFGLNSGAVENSHTVAGMPFRCFRVRNN